MQSSRDLKEPDGPGAWDRSHGSSMLGTAISVVGRAADPAIQHSLFTRGFAAAAIARVGLAGADARNSAVAPGLSGLGTLPTLLVCMYGAASLRHIYWSLVMNNYVVTPAFGCQVAIYNLLVDTGNTLAAAYTLSRLGAPAAQPSTDAPGWTQWAGLGLFITGIFIEMYSEETRKAFKKDARNKGKVDQTGLWGFVRHPNYLGYALWRAGLALTTGAFTWAALFTAFQVYCFTLSIPGLAGQMRERYGSQWVEYERRVRWKLIPGVY